MAVRCFHLGRGFPSHPGPCPPLQSIDVSSLSYFRRSGGCSTTLWAFICFSALCSYSSLALVAVAENDNNEGAPSLLPSPASPTPLPLDGDRSLKTWNAHRQRPDSIGQSDRVYHSPPLAVLATTHLHDQSALADETRLKADDDRERLSSIAADTVKGIGTNHEVDNNTTLAWSPAIGPRKLPPPLERHAGRSTDEAALPPELTPARLDVFHEFDAEAVQAIIEAANRPSKRVVRNTVEPPTMVLPFGSDIPSSSPWSSQKFTKLYIDAGGEGVRDIFSNDWNPDSYYVGGVAFNDFGVVVDGTKSGSLYQSQRVGTFDYEIPVPEGNYELILHFAELNENTTAGVNVFNIEAEKRLLFPNVDIVGLIGSPRMALTLETAIVIVDGHLSLSFWSVNGLPTLSAIEIDLVGDHLAHAVAGDYEEVDVDSDGLASVHVDGTLSHTHGVGMDLIAWQWYKDGSLLGIGETTTLTLPVGEHDIVLKVLDNGGNHHSEAFTVTVHASGYPVISTLSPSFGDLAGGALTLIQGFGYHFHAEQTTVRFGAFNISSDNISVTNSSQIQILAVPPSERGIPVSVSVITPDGESNKVLYTYIDRVPIEWSGKALLDVPFPTTLTFGPDQKLYVGTRDGKLLKISLTSTFNAVLNMVESSIVNSDASCLHSNCRTILGIAFDPLDTSPDPSVYLSHSMIFHGSRYSSSSDAVNGKVSRVSGSNLDVIEDIITGLPVSDHDHAVNGLEFGDHGELYILVGGNTNAGVPGSMSGSKLQKEGLLSAAALVAYLKRVDFDGQLLYDQLDDGNLINGSGVEVFSSGLRNPYDLVLHSMNGNLYATDNGPNSGYGKISVGCDQGVDDAEEEDELNLLTKGGYYGHANRKRGEQDPSQCIWKSPKEPSSGSYVAPLAIIPASSDGIIEFQSNHFQGQLRGNLIIAMYNGGLYRAILSSDGRAVVPEANPPFLMTSDGGLDVTQGPSGELYTVKYKGGKLRVLVPIEPYSDALSLISVFPRRGHITGGTTLHVYGKNLASYGVPVVQVGDAICSLASLGPSHVTCVIPPGSGRADVSMFAGNQTSVLRSGYRFITGAPVPTEPPIQAPFSNHSTVPFMPSVMPMSVFTPFALRLNAGGGYYTDSLGQLWQTDAFQNFFKGPSRIALTEQNILATENKHLFQSARVFRRKQPGPYLYDIPVPVPGMYRVNLGFAEIVERRTEIGDRMVNVTIENVPVVDNFDVVKEAGAAYTAIMTSHRVLVLDGAATLQFTSVKFDPMISAIEIVLEDLDLSGIQMTTHFPISSPSALPAPTFKSRTAIARLNAGGEAYIDSKGNSWKADLHHHGPSGTSQTNHSIENTNDEPLFQSSRFFRRRRHGPFFYEIPVPIAMNYTVVLGFAEIADWRTEVGDRRMIIAVENDTVLDDFDIVEAAGAAYTATYKTFDTSVHDGNLTIVFTPFKYNPSVSTIEVFLGTL